jgi:NAD(P)-dependent dehydrogenase (short-subunit alcohol dehydrogenase family)
MSVPTGNPSAPSGARAAALITGAAHGQGRATALALAADGYDIVALDVAKDLPYPAYSMGSSGELESLASEVPTRCLTFVADVRDDAAVSAAVQGAVDAFGRIDVLFNNAGISPDDDVSVLDTSLEAWQRVQDVNLKSVFLCCKHGIPHLLDAGGGSVINTASFVAVLGAATSQISYTASKGAVLSLSRELGVEFARRGVRVNALCPGPVDTPLLRELYASDPAKAARRLIHVPMGRFAQASEIAAAALFLASDESSYVNASTFMVDGGISGAYVTPE